MSSRSNWWFLDLLAVALYAVGAGAALYLGVVDGMVRAAVAVPLVVFLPGYALISLIYPAGAEEMEAPNAGLRDRLPRQRSIDGVERIALAVAASIAVVPSLWLVADLTLFGITFLPILASVVAFTVLFAILALLARWRTPRQHRFAPVRFGLLFSASRRGYGRRDDSSGTMVFNAAVVVSLLLVVSSVGFAVVNQPNGQQFTGLYPKTEPVDGQTQTMYPDQFAAGQSQTLPMVVHNHEDEHTKYTMVAVLQRVGENNRTQEEEEVGRTSFALNDGQKKTVGLPIEPSMQDERLRLRILLYEGNAPNDPSLSNADYALPRLWVSVGENPPNQGSSNEGTTGENNGSTGGGPNGGGGQQTTTPPATTTGGNDGPGAGTMTTTTVAPGTTTQGGFGDTTTTATTTSGSPWFGTTTTRGGFGDTTTTSGGPGGPGRTTTTTSTDGTTTTTDDGFLARAPPSR